MVWDVEIINSERKQALGPTHRAKRKQSSTLAVKEMD